MFPPGSFGTIRSQIATPTILFLRMVNEIGNDDEDDHSFIPVVDCPRQLLSYGIVANVPISNIECTNDVEVSSDVSETGDDESSSRFANNKLAWMKLGRRLSVVTPAIMTAEGDGEYAFYRNILDEPEFPFAAILDGGKSAIGKAILRYFHVHSIENENEIRLDDAFCIHYNMDQTDTRGAKHMDPSDITVNLCLDKSADCRGSQVLFYGTKTLQDIVQTETKDDDSSIDRTNFRFLVNQEPGYATLHWGNHPHATSRLLKGHRTNIVVTYCYTDRSRSDVSSRACYNV